MKKSIITSTLFIISTFVSYGQELTRNNTPISEQFGFSMGYFGDKISNSGIQIGVENYLATTNNYKIIGSFHFATFGVKQIFTAISFNPRIGLRYTADFGLTLESHIGLGYLQRFYKYDEFDVNSTGQIISKGKASQVSAMPNFALGVGYDFRKKTNLPILFFVRASVNYNYPNKFYLFEASYALETGLIYVPKF